MKKYEKLAFMAGIFNAMAQPHSYNKRTNEEVLSRHEPKKIIPKGCKEYFFLQSGSVYTINTEGLNVIFSCIAISQKAAQKKFDKWYAENQK